MSAAKRILRYVRGTSSFGLRYEKGEKNYSIEGFSDNDFAVDSEDRKCFSLRILLSHGTQ